jgi:hypothetical protein
MQGKEEEDNVWWEVVAIVARGSVCLERRGVRVDREGAEEGIA